MPNFSWFLLCPSPARGSLGFIPNNPIRLRTLPSNVCRLAWNPTPEELWHEVQRQVRYNGGLLVLDDSILDKPYARCTDLVRWHWSSGKHHRPVKDINLLTLLWTDGDRYVLCDYRLYDKIHNGLNTCSHAQHANYAIFAVIFAPVPPVVGSATCGFEASVV